MGNRGPPSEIFIMAGSVKVIDHGWKKIQEEMKKCDGTYVKVGYPSEKGLTHEPKKDESGPADKGKKGGKGKAAKPILMADLAAIMEFGTADGHIPARPFMASTFDMYVEEVLKNIASIKDQIISGKITAKQGWGKIGAWYKGRMQHTIKDSVWQANADITIKLKGSSAPLIDSGALRTSIDYEVVGRAGKK